MNNGTVKIGHIVNIDGNQKRYIVTAIQRASSSGQREFVNLRALSGGTAGSGPEVGVGRVTMATSQDITFSGSEALARKNATLRSLNGIGRMTVREHYCDPMIEGETIDSLIERVANAQVTK